MFPVGAAEGVHLQHAQIHAKLYFFHAIGTAKNSMEIQQGIAELGGSLIVPYSELIDYVNRDLFPRPYLSRVRLNLDWFTPNFVQNEIPVIVHAPTKKRNKISTNFSYFILWFIPLFGFGIHFRCDQFHFKTCFSYFSLFIRIEFCRFETTYEYKIC